MIAGRSSITTLGEGIPDIPSVLEGADERADMLPYLVEEPLQGEGGKDRKGVS